MIQSSDKALSSNDLEMQFDHVDRITLYRTLKTFETKGIIHKAVDGTNVQKYAMCVEGCSEASHQHQHAHFHCDSCNSTFCIDDIQIPAFPKQSSFQVKTIEMIVKGTCVECR